MSYEEWLRHVNSHSFWEYIEKFPNFSKMILVINDSNTMKELIMLLRNEELSDSISIEIKNNLTKSNICKVGFQSTKFATRFVQLFVERKIRQLNFEPQNFPLKSVVIDGKQLQRVDLPKLIKIVVKYMNRSNIILVQTKKNNTDQSNEAEQGPKDCICKSIS